MRIFPADENTFFDAVGHVRDPVRIEIIFQLQNGPRITANADCVVRRFYGQVKPREMIEPVPQAILEVEMKRFPFLCFPPHTINTPLFEAVKSHDVGRAVFPNSWRKLAQQTVYETAGRVNVYD